MKGRCAPSGSQAYANVDICPTWMNYIGFRDWVVAHIGRPSPGDTLDRIDGTRGYVPGNIRWASKQTQARNRACVRRITHPRTGETLLLVEWAERLGITPSGLSMRMDKYGWSVEKALDTPRKG